VAQDEYAKKELFIGFSHGNVDGSTGLFVHPDRNIGDTGGRKFNGFNAAGVYNFARNIGVKIDVSGTYQSGNFTRSTVISGRTRNSLYNVLAGIQFKDNSHDRRIKPFGHVLAGGAFARTDVDATCTGTCPPSLIPTSGSDSGFAMVFGGGFDIKLNERFDVRAFQLDYNPIAFDDSRKLQNLRVSVGIVIK
jgi:hypothetical protein